MCVYGVEPIFPERPDLKCVHRIMNADTANRVGDPEKQKLEMGEMMITLVKSQWRDHCKLRNIYLNFNTINNTFHKVSAHHLADAGLQITA